MENKKSKVVGSEVPKNIPEPETIEQTNQKFLDAWVNYFKNLSLRIKIIFPNEEKFNFEEIKAKTALLKNLEERDKEKIVWPENKLAFLITFNSSILEEEKEYLVKNTYLFYFGDTAFSLDHFEADFEIIGHGSDFRDDDPEYNYLGTYSISGYEDSALSWAYISSIIKNRIKELEEQVPLPPENS